MASAPAVLSRLPRINRVPTMDALFRLRLRPRLIRSLPAVLMRLVDGGRATFMPKISLFILPSTLSFRHLTFESMFSEGHTSGHDDHCRIFTSNIDSPRGHPLVSRWNWSLHPTFTIKIPACFAGKSSSSETWYLMGSLPGIAHYGRPT